MAVHRIITTSLGAIEEVVSSERRTHRDLPPPITVLDRDETNQPEPLVQLQPKSDVEPLGSVKWRIGRHSLLVNNEHFSTTPIFSTFTFGKDFFERIGGGSAPAKINLLDCMFFTHQNNWLSNLTSPDHADLYRFIFSSKESWGEDSVLNARVDLASTPEEAIAKFTDRSGGTFSEIIDDFAGPISHPRVSPQTALFDYAWNERVIVIEQSPPFLTSLKELLLSSNGVAIGGFIGAAAGMEHPVFLLATVPLGIVVVAAAVGAGLATQQVMQQVIRERLLLLLDGKAEVTNGNPSESPADLQAEDPEKNPDRTTPTATNSRTRATPRRKRRSP